MQRKDRPIMQYYGTAYDNVNREDTFVDLAITTGKEVDEKWQHSDRNYHMEQTYDQKESISMENIMSIEDQYVCIRGIAGIGKSTLVDTMVLKWSTNKMFNGDENTPKIDFLFRVNCSKLNMLPLNDFVSCEDLLKSLFPPLRNFSMEDFNSLGGRTLLIIDGIDELTDVDKLPNLTALDSSNIHPMVKCLHDLISPSSDTLPKKKVMIVGRPQVCNSIKKMIERCQNVKIVEICGFSETGVDTYINRTFAEDGTLAEKVRSTVVESENLQVMSHIPVYLWIICGLFREDVSIQSPKTCTELYIYSCLVFLRKHYKEMILQEKTLTDMCMDRRLLLLVSKIASMSFETYSANKVIFKDTDVADLSSIEQTGFIQKAQCGEHGYLYQFHHLTFQEFFCALHIFLTHKNTKYNYDNFQSLLPILAGLEGIARSSGLLHLFVENIYDVVNNEKPVLISIMDYFDKLPNIRNR